MVALDLLTSLQSHCHDHAFAGAGWVFPSGLKREHGHRQLAQAHVWEHLPRWDSRS